MSEATTTITVPAGTIVFHHSSVPGFGGREELVTLLGDCIVEATRLSDGRWGYAVGKQVYSCAGGAAIVAAPFTPAGQAVLS